MADKTQRTESGTRESHQQNNFEPKQHWMEKVFTTITPQIISSWTSTQWLNGWNIIKLKSTELQIWFNQLHWMLGGKSWFPWYNEAASIILMSMLLETATCIESLVYTLIKRSTIKHKNRLLQQENSQPLKLLDNKPTNRSSKTHNPVGSSTPWRRAKQINGFLVKRLC